MIGTSLAVATQRIAVPGRDTITAVTFTDNGRRAFTRQVRDRPVLTMVRREDFDLAWHDAAIAAGAKVQQNAPVRTIAQDD